RRHDRRVYPTPQNSDRLRNRNGKEAGRTRPRDRTTDAACDRSVLQGNLGGVRPAGGILRHRTETLRAARRTSGRVEGIAGRTEQTARRLAALLLLLLVRRFLDEALLGLALGDHEMVIVAVIPPRAGWNVAHFDELPVSHVRRRQTEVIANRR